MNIAYFLHPKGQVAFLYDDYTFRQGLEKMKHHGYTAIPVISRTGQYVGTVSEGNFLWQLVQEENEVSHTMKELEQLQVRDILDPSAYPSVRITVTMDELLEKSDFVSLHTPALGDKPLVDAAFIAKMKDGAILINTSRGKNVDEAALLDALNSGKLRGAGLDVWFEEPTPNHDLYCHPAVSCTPHIGAQTVEAQKRIGAEVVDIISGFAF